MNTPVRWIAFSTGIIAVCVALLGAANAAKADGISFTVSNTSLTTTSGGTVTFDGTVTNDSGGDLHASDFFFNFFGFDPASVMPPVQDLGVSADFLIRSGTTSTIVALFDVTLETVPMGSSFPISVLLEDSNNDLSAVETVTVSVPGAVVTPEPASLLLLGMSLGGIFAARGKLNRKPNNT